MLVKHELELTTQGLTALVVTNYAIVTFEDV